MAGVCRRHAACWRRIGQDGLREFFQMQRKRHWDALHLAEQRLQRRLAAAQEHSLTSVYMVEQRGYTYGGTPCRTKFHD